MDGSRAVLKTSLLPTGIVFFPFGLGIAVIKYLLSILVHPYQINNDQKERVKYFKATAPFIRYIVSLSSSVERRKVKLNPSELLRNYAKRNGNRMRKEYV